MARQDRKSSTPSHCVTTVPTDNPLKTRVVCRAIKPPPLEEDIEIDVEIVDNALGFIETSAPAAPPKTKTFKEIAIKAFFRTLFKIT